MTTIKSQIRRAVNSIRKFQNNLLLPQTDSDLLPENAKSALLEIRKILAL
jgi:hypothetical protein